LQRDSIDQPAHPRHLLALRADDVVDQFAVTVARIRPEESLGEPGRHTEVTLNNAAAVVAGALDNCAVTPSGLLADPCTLELESNAGEGSLNLHGRIFATAGQPTGGAFSIMEPEGSHLTGTWTIRHRPL
jgi:hypothetical protein